MDQFTTFYFPGYYGVPFTVYDDQQQPISFDALNSHQMEAILQAHHHCDPIESSARVQRWLDAQMDAPVSIVTGLELFPANPLTVEIDGDMFIRSEAL